MNEREAEMRERITEAARELIFHYGFQKTTMADIAREAEISVGGLYNYFKNKEEICVACAEKFKHSLIERMEEAASGPEDSTNKLKNIMLTRNLAYHEHFRETQHGFEIVTSVMPKNMELVKKFTEMEVELISRVFAVGRERGELGDGATKETARTFLTAFSSFCPPLGFDLSEEEIREGTTRVVELLMPGLKADDIHIIAEK